MRSRRLVPALVFGTGLVAVAAGAASTAPPAPTQVIATDATMATVNKRQSGSFTLRWQPAHDASGRERKVYDVLTVDCANVRSASGAALPLATGGRLHSVSGPPYAVALSGCTCGAAAQVSTAPVAPETARSAPVDVRHGTIFGPVCK